MSPAAERTAPPIAAEPEQGVIDDARRRAQRRRRRGAILVSGLAAVAGLLAAISSSNSSPAPHARAHQRGALAIRSKQTLRGARLSPALTAGEYGWCLTLEGGGGSCPNLPTVGSPLQGALIATDPKAHHEVITLLLAPEVAGLLINGQRVQPLTLAGTLPYHLRVARVTISTSAAQSAALPTPHSILAINARGAVLQPNASSAPEAAPARITWWKSPRPAPAGPCQIHARGMPELLPKWGHAVAQIHRYPGKIIGSAFFSCVDSEFYLHNWPLETAVLLDAQHPGNSPAPIPGMAPLPHAPGVFEAPGDWHGDITATRRKHAWLVVAGGSGAAQRLEVLRHLTTVISLG